jgi:hypothetical protein
MLTLKLLPLHCYTYLVLTIGFSLLTNTTVEAQEDWVEYITMKDKGVMSIAIDLSVDMAKPNYKNILIVGTRFKSCLKNGFPREEGLDKLYAYSDSTSAVIKKSTQNRLVGIITYQCMGFDVYYVKDTLDIRTNLNRLIQENFSTQEAYVDIKRDKSWNYYYDFLYPNNMSLEFLFDQDYLRDLVLQGDDLKGLRKVNHWLYFKNVNLRNSAGKRLKILNFSLDSIAYKKESKLPYELKISRHDSINPNSIYQLTTLLRVLCASYKGQYDGWGTEVKVLE